MKKVPWHRATKWLSAPKAMILLNLRGKMEDQCYREALWEGFNRFQKINLLTTNSYINVYNVIKANSAGIRNAPGTKIATSTGKTLYTPPEGEKIIRDKLRSLEEFIHVFKRIRKNRPFKKQEGGNCQFVFEHQAL